MAETANEIAAMALEELACILESETPTTERVVMRLRDRSQALRSSSPKPDPAMEWVHVPKPETKADGQLYSYVAGSDEKHGHDCYERNTAAEAVVKAARAKRLLRAMLKQFGPSTDGAVERDIEAADQRLDEALAALDQQGSGKDG